MTLFEPFVTEPMVLRLGWTLFHFLWQATVVALIVAVALACVKERAASLRYAIASLALVFIVVMGVITYTQVSVSEPLPKARYSSSTSPMPAGVSPGAAGSPAVQATSGDTEPVFSWPAFRRRFVQRAEPSLPYAVMGWLLGVLTLSLMHLGGWTQLRRLRWQLTRPISAELEQSVRDLAQRLGVHRAFKVFESGLVQVPTAIGHVKPVILLPASALTGLSPEQIEIILAHELAHIRRHDYLINLIQTAIETLGFYHPAIWWLSHVIRQERENCCDDVVVASFRDPVGYADALANMAKIRSQGIDLAMAANGSSLVRRIERLLGADRPTRRRPAWLASMLCLIVVLALAIPTTVTFAAKDRRHRPVSEDVRATFNEWVNAIVDDDTKAFEIIAHKMALHRGTEPNETAIVASLRKYALQLKAYEGLDRLRIISMEDKGDHFDVLTSPVTDPQGVSGRFSIAIATETKPFYPRGDVRFITRTGTSYSVPQAVLIRAHYLLAPRSFPLLETLPDASGRIPPDALTAFKKALQQHPEARLIASPQVTNLSGETATCGIDGEEESFKTSFLATVRSDRTTIDLAYESDVHFAGERSEYRDRVTLPSGYAVYAKMDSATTNDQALYILIEPWALRGTGVNAQRIQSPSTKPSTATTALKEAFEEWLRAMRDNDPVAMDAIAAKQRHVCDLSETELIEQLRKDAEALQRYTDLGQFKIASVERQESRINIRTPVIESRESPEGYYLIPFHDTEPPIPGDGIAFVTTSGEKYPLHPQTLSTLYILSVPEGSPPFGGSTNAPGSISMDDLKALLAESKTSSDTTIVSKPKILTNSGESGQISTGEYTLSLTNRVLSDRMTISSDVSCAYEAEGLTTTLSAHPTLRSGECLLFTGPFMGKGRRYDTVMQVEVLSAKLDASAEVMGMSSRVQLQGPVERERPRVIKSNAYFCLVPKDWPLLKKVLSADTNPVSVFGPAELKAFLDGVEESPSAKLVASPGALYEENETQTIECDALENRDIDLKVTCRILEETNLLELDIALTWEGTLSVPSTHAVHTSRNVVTKVTTHANDAVAIGSIPEDDDMALLVILHSRRAD